MDWLKKYIILTLGSLLFMQILSGQDQDDILLYIRQKLQNYCKAVPWEEIYIHTDREEYISGEDMWFNIYLIDRQSLKPSTNSRIVYLEVLNSENKPVIQKRILLIDGSGPGQALLPDSLSSGRYIIRAYTNWMKNFLPGNCFIKEIQVYNALRTDISGKSFRLSATDDTLKYRRTDNPGIGVKVNNTRKDTLEIEIQTDETFRTDNKNTIYLLIQTRGIIVRLSREQISGQLTKITFPKKSLLPGISTITIFDSKGPVNDKYIFVSAEERELIDLKSSGIFKRRDKIILEIVPGSNPVQTDGLTNLSISVSGKSDSYLMNDIREYLIFGSEFGLSPVQSVKGRKFTDIPPAEIDTLLMSLQSRWIFWDKVFSDGNWNFRYPAEKEDHFISGTLLNSNLQPVSAEEPVLLSVPGKVATFQYARTDPDGNFSLGIHIDEELKDLVIQPDLSGKGQKVYLEPSFSKLYFRNDVTVNSAGLSGSASQMRTVYQVRKIFGSSSIGDCSSRAIPGIKAKRFYGIPDNEVILSNFIKLDSMREVFHELIPGILFQLSGSGYKLSVIDPSKSILDEIPCVMIDGVIIKDLKLIASLDPDLIEKIDVIRNRYRVGGYVFYGIINLITRSGDLSGVPIPDNAVRLNYRILDSSGSFISPDYSSPEALNSPVADYRNTLYWNPNVVPDKNGKAGIEFWSSDVKSEYVINITGFSSSGEFVTLKKVIKVD